MAPITSDCDAMRVREHQRAALAQGSINPLLLRLEALVGGLNRLGTDESRWRPHGSPPASPPMATFCVCVGSCSLCGPRGRVCSRSSLLPPSPSLRRSTSISSLPYISLLSSCLSPHGSCSLSVWAERADGPRGRSGCPRSRRLTSGWRSAGPRRLTAAIPMDSPCCSATLKHNPKTLNPLSRVDQHVAIAMAKEAVQPLGSRTGRGRRWSLTRASMIEMVASHIMELTEPVRPTLLLLSVRPSSFFP